MERYMENEDNLTRIQIVPFRAGNNSVYRSTIPIYSTGYDNERKKQARRHKFKFGLVRPSDLWELHETQLADLGNDDDIDEEIESSNTHWNSNYQSHMASISLVMGISNLIQFPYSCYLYGGSIFFLVYCVIVIVLVQPIILFEMIIGQFSMNGMIGFSNLNKHAAGLSLAVDFMSLVFVTLNNVVIGYSGMYSLSAFYKDATKCDPEWKHCIPMENSQPHSKGYINNTKLEHSGGRHVSSPEYLFQHMIMGYDLDHEGLTKGLSLNSWNVLAGFALFYVVIKIVVFKNLTSRCMKILISGALVLPVVLALLLVHQFANGGSFGSFSVLRWKFLHSFDMWTEAMRMALLTASVGKGLYSRVASRNKFKFDRIHKTSWLVCCALLGFTLLSSLIVFTEIEFIAHLEDTEDYLDVIEESNTFVSKSRSLELLYLLDFS